MSGTSLQDDKVSGRAIAARGRDVLAWLLSQRIRPLWITAVVLLVLFAGFRAGLLLARGNWLVDIGAAGITRCFVVGMRYDAMPIGYMLLPLALVLSLAPRRAFARPRFRQAVATYAVTIVALAAVVEVVGAAFFLHFGARLNWMVADHAMHPKEVAMYIWGTYPAWLVPIGFIALMYLGRRAFSRLFRLGPGPAERRLWQRVVLAVVSAALCITACRGGLGRRSLRQEAAYFSDNRVVIQLTMNNVFTLAKATRSHLNDGHDENELFPFPPDRLAVEVAKKLVFQPGDAPQGVRGNPFWRRVETHRRQMDYNMVLILMESMAGKPVGAMGYSPTHTPNFDALCREGMFFNRVYGVGGRTNRGMMGTLCGHPDLRGQTILKRPLAQGKFLTLPGIFRNRGYRTLFIYGGDPNFDNMRGFLSGNGVETVIGQEQIASNGLAGNWGVPDEMMLKKAHATFLQLDRAGKKFFAAVLTVSNHEPYDLPTGRCELLPGDDEKIKRINGFRYADWALGQFFRMARTAQYFKRTIFVLVADHGRNWDQRRILDLPSYRIPLLIYAPGIITPGASDVVASQTDIPPTILSLLGGTFEHCFLGRNLLAVEPGDGFAFLHEDYALGFVRRDRAIVYPPLGRPLLFRIDDMNVEKIKASGSRRDVLRTLQRDMFSFYLIAKRLYFDGAYVPPQRRQTTTSGPQ
ncbi:MAG: sulfatase-like hydrolase/transferase [Planctomycetota bacterium]|nr:sulfatase-like hydrolase/transferase [Planctomycetota bacterium]